MIIGAVAGMEGFDEGEDATLLGSVLWFSFTIGALVGLVAGVVALVVGRKRGVPADSRAGLLALGWFLLGVLAIVVINLLG